MAKDRESAAECHAEELTKRKGKSIESLLSAFAAEGYYKPAFIHDHLGTHWLRLYEPSCRFIAEVVALTPSEFDKLAHSIPIRENY